MSRSSSAILVNLCRLLCILLVFFGSCSPEVDSQREPVAAVPSTTPDTFTIPSVTGSMILDGELDDEIWQDARKLALENRKIQPFGFGKGGESRIAVRGDHLLLSARLPESGRLVAFSTGINPVWWSEDTVSWIFRFRSRSAQTIFWNASLVINPFGACSFRNKGISATSPTRAIEWAGDIQVAAAIREDEWTVEVALPLEEFGEIGMLKVERTRAARPDTPQLCWYWPEPNQFWKYELSKSTPQPAPQFQPPPLPSNAAVPQPASPEVPLAMEVESLPDRVWTAEQREVLGIEAMLGKSIQSRIEAFVEKDKQDWQEVKTAEDWERFRDRGIRAMKDSLGALPEPAPLVSMVTRRINPGHGFVIENVVYESQPRILVTANLYSPERPSGKIPAVVVVHSHHQPKTQLELQNLGMTWARAGTAVLVMDQLCAGERLQSQPWNRESYYGRYALGSQLYLAGESMLKWMVWDIMRGIDLLLERSYIDPDRIVLLGAVAGGGEPTAVTTLLDPRISVSIPFNCGHSHSAWAYWETPRNIPGSIVGQFFEWTICQAAAPRYFIYSHEAGWQRTTEERALWGRYERIFELYNARNNLAVVDGIGKIPGPGDCVNVSTFHRNRIDPILNRWLQVPVPDLEYQNPLPEKELVCLTPEVAAELAPQAASSLVIEQVRKRLADSRKVLAALPKTERRERLRRQLGDRLGDSTPNPNPVVQELWSRKGPNLVQQAFVMETEPGILIPVILILPSLESSPKPAVIAFAQGGKERFLSERSNGIAELLEAGVVVCLTDPRGIGELSDHTSRGPSAMDHAANELLLGRTLVGARLRDARTLFHWLAQRPDIHASQIALWGDSFSHPNAPDFEFDQSYLQKPGPVEQRQSEPLGPFLAVLTALYEDQVVAVAGRGGLVSFLSVLEDRFCHLPQDVVVPGILEIADLSDLVASLAPRPVLLQELVSGLNKKVSLSDMEREYGAATSRLELRDQRGDSSLAHWLSRECQPN